MRADNEQTRWIYFQVVAEYSASGVITGHVGMATDISTRRKAEEALEVAGLTVNKNAIPFDTQSRFVTGGIRLGTAAVTTRGLKEKEMGLIADWINHTIDNYDKPDLLGKVRLEVQMLCEKFPIYPHLRKNH